MSNNGWICPKCGNVYAPFMMECKSCNKIASPNLPLEAFRPYASTVPGAWCNVCNKYMQLNHLCITAYT